MGDIVPIDTRRLPSTLAEAYRRLERAASMQEKAGLLEWGIDIEAKLARRRAGIEIQNPVARFVLECQRSIGGDLAADPKIKRGGDQKSKGHDDRLVLADLGVDHNQSKRWQRLRRVPDHVWDESLDEREQQLEEITTAWMLELARRLESGRAVVGSETNEWYTPAVYIEAARAVLGGIDLDPASCDEANVTVQADDIYTEEDDGLAQRWEGRVWLNPPYGRIAGDFIVKLCDEHEAGNVKAAVALVNAHCTDTAWFQRLWDHTLCFTDHRIDFAAGTEARSGSTHGSVFAYLGDDLATFHREFERFGAVVRRYRP